MIIRTYIPAAHRETWERFCRYARGQLPDRPVGPSGAPWGFSRVLFDLLREALDRHRAL